MATILRSSVGLSTRTLSPAPADGIGLIVAYSGRAGTGGAPGTYTASPEGDVADSVTDKVAVAAKIASGEATTLSGFNGDNLVAWLEVDGLDGMPTAFDSSSATGSGPTSQAVPVGPDITVPTNGIGIMVIGIGSGGGFDAGGGYFNAFTPGAGWTKIVDQKVFDGHPETLICYTTTPGVITPTATFINDGQPPWPWAVIAVSYSGVASEPDPGIDVGVYDPDDVFIATLDDAIEKQIKPMLNGTGVGSFKLNRYSPNATADILRGGNLVKVTIPRIDPDPIFSFFLEDEKIVLVSDQEHGGELISITGNGGLSYLARAIWLASSFVIDWWPATMATPPAGTKGAIIVKPGTYRRYTIAGGVITGYVNFTTATGFSAYFDSRRTYQWPSENSKRFLVHITTTEDPSSPSHVGHYFHPHQDGVKEYLPSYALNTSINLTDIGDGDKPGQVLYRMYQEAVAASRPTHPVPLLTVDFTDTTDSNGDPWTTTDALIGVTAELGETYLDTLGKLLGTGVLDVIMGVDLQLHAYNHYGRDLTGTSFGPGVVRFAKGVNIADQLERQRRPEPVATWAQVIGTNDAVAEAELPDAASRIPRETSIRGETDNETALEALGLAELQRQLVASDAIAFRITTDDDDEDVGKYLPGPEGTEHGKFWLGDLVTLHTGTGEQDFDEADERVVAVTIAEDDARNLEVTPEVGSTIEGDNGLLRSAGSSLTGVVATTISDGNSTEPVGDHGALSGLDDDDHPQYGPSSADYLVGTAQAGLSAEIVVGTTPGGELGGTWASPTVDGTHSGSAHTDFIAKSVLTTQDDIIVRDGTGPARLGKGSDGQVLTVDPTTHHLVWATPTGGSSDLDTILAASTGQDIADALLGAAAPDAGNVFATMADVGGSGGLAQSFLGYNTIGGTWTATAANRHYVKKVTLATDGLLTSIDIYIRSNADATTLLTPVLTTDASGVPDHLIIRAAVASTVFQETSSGAQPGRWVAMPIGAWLTAGDYWIGFWCSSTGLDIANDGSGSDVFWTSAGQYVSGTYYNSGKTTGSVKYSIRASILS